MIEQKLRTIKIKKRVIPEWLTLFVFVMPFFLSFFTDFLGLPGFFKYSIDIAWVGLFLFLFVRNSVRVKKQLWIFVLLVSCFFFYLLTVYIFNFQSLFYFLWGIRNNFRFYIAFFSFAIFLSEESKMNCLKFIDVLFWVNGVVSFAQFFLLGYKQDHLGGIFGIEEGCNAYSIILFSLVVAKALLSYMNGTEKGVSCFLKCGVSLVLSALAELKFFFVIFVLILIAAALFTKFSWRKFLVLFVSVLLMMFASSVLSAVFNETGDISFERIIELATSTSYSTKEDLGRFTALPTISKNFLTTLPKKLFGLGIGNCDTSAFAICNTPFFQANQAIHYTWFSSAFLFLETGYLGLTINLSFYVTCFIFSFFIFRQNKVNTLFCQLAIIFSVLCVVLTFYNASLRREVGYIAYFILALPFVANAANNNN